MTHQFEAAIEDGRWVRISYRCEKVGSGRLNFRFSVTYGVPTVSVLEAIRFIEAWRSPTDPPASAIFVEILPDPVRQEAEAIMAHLCAQRLLGGEDT